MAGFTSASNFPLKPISTPSLHSLESNLFALRSRNRNLSFRSVPSAVVTAQYGWPGSSGRGDWRRSRQSYSEEYRALDVSGIRSATVRLIDENQNMVGVVSKSEAIEMAEGAELDLVVLSPEANPPVLRIVDYNKYRYEQQKKRRVQQKKSPANCMDLKELKMGYNIDQHDYGVHLKTAQKFLKDGDKVKIMVNLKGRENDFRNIAIELIRRFQNDIGELATEETKKFSDRNIFITLVPNKAVLQKAQEPPKKKEKSAITEVSVGI